MHAGVGHSRASARRSIGGRLAMLYRYKALTRTGANLAGEMEALDRTTVLQDLHQLGHFPIEVSEIKGSQSGASSARRSFLSGQPSSRQITHFTR